MRTFIFAAIAGIAGLILAVIEQRAGWDLGIWPYVGVGAICGLLNIATDKDN